LLKQDKLAKRCAEYGYTACGIADLGTISGAVEFHQECKKYDIKPVIGCEFDGFILYAKNKERLVCIWLSMCQIKIVDVLKEISREW